LDTINEWIEDLSKNFKGDNISWGNDDMLECISSGEKVSMMVSVNKRYPIKNNKTIKLYHLWVNLK
ncbi:MAG: hypothetical protein KAS17_03690, partial [Victivallaceae bacterium]|nr:hypothetical protein [Victivallaceae bacterium]